MEPPPVGKAEIVHPGVRGIEDPQPHKPCGHGKFGADHAVDQHLVAAKAPHHVHHTDVIGHATGAVEVAVLHDQREIIDPVIARQWVLHVGIVNDDHASKPPIDLIGGAPVDMAVIPQGRRGVVHRQLGRPRLAGAESQLRPTVEAAGHMHAVPMGGDRLIGAVHHVDPCRAPALKPQQRAEVILIVAQRVGGGSGNEFA